MNRRHLERIGTEETLDLDEAAAVLKIDSETLSDLIQQGAIIHAPRADLPWLKRKSHVSGPAALFLANRAWEQAQKELGA